MYKCFIFCRSTRKYSCTVPVDFKKTKKVIANATVVVTTRKKNKKRLFQLTVIESKIDPVFAVITEYLKSFAKFLNV